MNIVGLTGGIGSGKTTFCQIAQQYNINVIDTDVIGRALLHEENLKNKICLEFNLPNNLDTKAFKNKLRQLLLEQDLRAHLESLLHPPIFDKVLFELQRLQSDLSNKFVFIVIPIIRALESWDLKFHDTITIESHQILIRQRLLQRYQEHNQDFIDKIARVHEQDFYNRKSWARQILWNNCCLDNWKDFCHQFLSKYTKNIY